MIYTPTKENIDAFCVYTKDNNRIHNSELMKEQGRKAVVPAMYLLFRDLSSLENPHEAKTVSLEMNKICSVGDVLMLDKFTGFTSEDIWGYKEKDVLSSDKEPAYIIRLADKLIENTSDIKEKPHYIDIKICEKSVKNLEKQFKPENDLSRTLSLMTSTSGIMLAAIKDPVNDHEQKIKELIERQNLLPVYKGFTYAFPEGLKPIKSRNASYSVAFLDETSDIMKSKRKQIFSKLNCKTDDLEFNSYFHFELIPEKIVIRGLEKLV